MGERRGLPPSPAARPRQGQARAKGAYSQTGNFGILNLLCHRTGFGSQGVGAVSGRRLFMMPRNKDLKRLARARMAETGERYTQALTHLLSQPVLEPLSAAWFMT